MAGYTATLASLRAAGEAMDGGRGVPTLLGETGIAMDLNGKAAFRPKPPSKGSRYIAGAASSGSASVARAVPRNPASDLPTTRSNGGVVAGGDGDWSMHIAALDNIMVGRPGCCPLRCAFSPTLFSSLVAFKFVRPLRACAHSQRWTRTC